MHDCVRVVFVCCRLLVQLLQTGATWKAMPNVVGAIRNLCQNSSVNKDVVRIEGGITGVHAVPRTIAFCSFRGPARSPLASRAYLLSVRICCPLASREYSVRRGS